MSNLDGAGGATGSLTDSQPRYPELDELSYIAMGAQPRGLKGGPVNATTMGFREGQRFDLRVSWNANPNVNEWMQEVEKPGWVGWAAPVSMAPHHLSLAVRGRARDITAVVPGYTERGIATGFVIVGRRHIPYMDGLPLDEILADHPEAVRIPVCVGRNRVSKAVFLPKYWMHGADAISNNRQARIQIAGHDVRVPVEDGPRVAANALLKEIEARAGIPTPRPPASPFGSPGYYVGHPLSGHGPELVR